MQEKEASKVFDWVDATSPNPMDRSGDFKLVCSYPRLLFNMQEHSGTSLKDAGLAPDASLFVEEDWAEEAQVCSCAFLPLILASGKRLPNTS